MHICGNQRTTLHSELFPSAFPEFQPLDTGQQTCTESKQASYAIMPGPSFKKKENPLFGS